jgi:hypothetical protein
MHWINRLFTVFSFWEAGCPSKAQRIESVVLSAAVPSPQTHRDFINNLWEMVHPFTRCKVLSETLNRGARNIAKQIDKLSFSSYHGIDIHEVDQLVSSALKVNPSRVSLPEKGGTCDPLNILTGNRKVEFENMIHSIPLTYRSSA